MRSQAILLASVCSIAPALCAQQSAIQVMSLKPTAKVEVPTSHRASLLGQAACDGAGNIYIRQLDAETSRNPMGAAQLPILEVTPTGTLTKTFRVTDAFAGDVFGTGAYVSQMGGGIYQAAMLGDDVFVIQYAQDGSVKTRKKLQVGSRHFTNLSSVAVFSSGEYLLVGESGKTGHIPFTAIFATDGRLLKEIYEPEDEEARRRAESGDVQYAGSGNTGNNFVSMADVAVGSDGNAYLLHGTSPTLIYVISPAGAVVRKLRISVDDPEMAARSVKAYRGRLAIGFIRSSDAGISIKMIDLKGNAVADYGMDAVGPYSLALACYGAGSLTLIPYFAETKLYLLTANLP